MGKGCNPLSAAQLKKRRAVASKKAADEARGVRGRIASYAAIQRAVERGVARAWRKYGGGWPALSPFFHFGRVIFVIDVAGCR